MSLTQNQLRRVDALLEAGERIQVSNGDGTWSDALFVRRVFAGAIEFIHFERSRTWYGANRITPVLDSGLYGIWRFANPEARQMVDST